MAPLRGICWGLACAWRLRGPSTVRQSTRCKTRKPARPHPAMKMLSVRLLFDDELVGDEADCRRVHLHKVLLVLAHHGRYRGGKHCADILRRLEIELDHAVERRLLAGKRTRHCEGCDDAHHR